MSTKLSIRDYSMAVALIAIWVFFAIKSDQFLGPRNLSMLAIELSITATLALGMLLVLLSGLIDLSVGSGVGLLGGIAAVLVFQHNLPAGAAMLVSVVTGVAVWSLMGFLIVREKVPAFIITLGGLLVFKGVFWLVIHNATIPVTRGNVVNLYSALTTYYIPPWVGGVLAAIAGALIVYSRLKSRIQRRKFGLDVADGETTFLTIFVILQGMLLLVLTLNQFRGIPLSLAILCGIALLVSGITRNTRFGRYLYAIGGNEEAAVLSGVPVTKVIVGAYALLGGIVALTGLMQTAYAGASTTTIGELMELDAIAACVIGGTSLKGGRGSVLGVLFGSLIMASLLNGMTLLAVSPEQKFIARGLVLVLAVWLDVVLSRKTK
jgi:D-xylose transport system permease protein